MASKFLVCSSMLLATVSGHGLITKPKSRNQFCGEEIRPDQSAGTYCEEAFTDDMNGGYQFMSVLTHVLGRDKVTPLPKNVCGFDSETWNGGATPWDKPLDWPTTVMRPGRNEFVWNVNYGPHFDDTDEFRYYITKPGFEYKVGVALTWDDFESTAFCYLPYNDATPESYPNVVADKEKVIFTTYCDVPERSGRHVIYAEWGRRESTFERFHSCMDLNFDGSTQTPEPSRVPTPKPSPTPVPPPTPAPVRATPNPPPAPGTPCAKYAGCAHDPTCCVASTCMKQSQYYSQCLTECPPTWECNKFANP